MVGSTEGAVVGVLVGEVDGICVGIQLGDSLGICELGLNVGSNDGIFEG